MDCRVSKIFFLTSLIFFAWHSSAAEKLSGKAAQLSGVIIDATTSKPIPFAAVYSTQISAGITTNDKGEFTLTLKQKGTYAIAISCLGYQRVDTAINLHADMRLNIALQPESFALDEVVVTAQKNKNDISSSYTINRASLDHMQVTSVADVTSLLPGGQTNTDLHLATSEAQHIAIHSATSEQGNPTFGTAIEVDGVRLSNNAMVNTDNSATKIYGVDTRSIATNNIGSVEVVTGIPSVEYGDMTNGVVKISTKKGRSPLIIEATTKPNTKQLSLQKGFSLNRFGTLNASAERTRSIADLASPYTSYERNSLSLLYSNTFNKANNRPLMLEAGLSGNIGGYNNEKDPDAFLNTYKKSQDNSVRANAKLNWVVNVPWLTAVEVSGAVSYANNLFSENTNKSSSSSVAAIHSTEEGYFVATRYDDNPQAPIVLIPAGYWYELQHVDNRLLNTSARAKATWAYNSDKVGSNLFVGADFSSEGNLGRGVYYDDLRYAASKWREYRFDELPFMNNIAVYAEEKLTVRLGVSNLQISAGVRSDFTIIKDSDYGIASSLSPRLNTKYTLWENKNRIVEKLTLRAGWGKAVKLPSFDVLYPKPDYFDELAFAPGTMADGTTFYAYHTTPYKAVYNPDLKWQSSQQTEAGFEASLKGVYIYLSVFYNKTLDPYTRQTLYVPFTYNFTDQAALNGSLIPSANRQYYIDQNTGVVTVTDKTGAMPNETLAYQERNKFKSNYTYVNGSPIVRKGVEWIVETGKIRSLQTSVRLDGSYYWYRSTSEVLGAYAPTTQNGVDGNPYKYVGYYAGGNGTANGSETRRLNSNLTLTTHIPAVRLVVSLKLESTLYDYKQNLSEYSGGQRSFALDSKDDLSPAANNPNDIYNSSRFVGMYPLYYVSHDDMQTQIPFAEKLAWAKTNDAALYNDLTKLIVRSNTDYYFNADRLSAYFSANVSVTKEIGKMLSITFNATNFTNNMQQVHTSASNADYSIYENPNSYIPKFYYGLSVRIKLWG